MFTDTILCCAPDIHAQWRQAIRNAGLTVHWVPLRTQPQVLRYRPKVWIVALDSYEKPRRYAEWWRTLPDRVVLITEFYGEAQKLDDRHPHLNVIVHPSRAYPALADMVHMACMFDGPAMTFGPMKSATEW